MGMAAPRVPAVVPDCMRTTDTFTPEDIIPAIEGTNVKIFSGVASNSFMTMTSIQSEGREAYMAQYNPYVPNIVISSLCMHLV
ncbi:hypothetical protein HYC85_010413 [Camellia sinensis]|uniref:Uncharacterized protein n=1 Tax=Camellia sinensis TaxID=4442 RepID=A0A7J7HIC6_CAMSI|nr:hypothetical protein HYC85_010413 [Camellia sinensis]